MCRGATCFRAGVTDSKLGCGSKVGIHGLGGGLASGLIDAQAYRSWESRVQRRPVVADKARQHRDEEVLKSSADWCCSAAFSPHLSVRALLALSLSLPLSPLCFVTHHSNGPRVLVPVSHSRIDRPATACLLPRRSRPSQGKIQAKASQVDYNVLQ